jgi:TRAP-type C4-dicarboxylate transport system permease small subunit
MVDERSTAVGTMRRWLALLLEVGAAAAFLVMVVSLILQILFRYALSIVAPWTEELARFACIWAVFLGTAVCFEEGTHIKLDLILAKVSGRAALGRALMLANVVVTSVFVAVVLYGSLLLVQLGWVDVATTIPVRMGIVYLAVPVSMGAIALFGSLRLVDALAGRSASPMPLDGTPKKGPACS